MNITIKRWITNKNDKSKIHTNHTLGMFLEPMLQIVYFNTEMYNFTIC